MFVFIIALVLIVSIGRTVREAVVESIRRRPQLGEDSPQAAADAGGVREAIDGVIGRLERLEEERDFYRDLLDSPTTQGEIPPPGAEAEGADTDPA